MTIPWRRCRKRRRGSWFALDCHRENVASVDPTVVPRCRPATLSWVLAAYSVVFGALSSAPAVSPTLGAPTDLFVRLLIFTAGIAAVRRSTSAWLLIGGRVSRQSVPPSHAGVARAAADATPGGGAQAVAMWGGVSALAVATGPSLGSLLIDAAGGARRSS